MSFERFTDRARKVMQLAHQDASQNGHEYVGTEHLLVGLAKEAGCVAHQSMIRLGLKSRETIIALRAKHAPSCILEPSYAGRLPHTPALDRVVKTAISLSEARNDRHVGTEHLLLGLAVEPKDSTAGLMLAELDWTAEKIQDAVNQEAGARKASKLAPATNPTMQTYLNAGLTQDEAEALAASGDLWMKIITLPGQHPSDKTEASAHIHALQNMIMARLTARRIGCTISPRPG